MTAETPPPTPAERFREIDCLSCACADGVCEAGVGLVDEGDES